jgi:hypothetical protein
VQVVKNIVRMLTRTGIATLALLLLAAGCGGGSGGGTASGNQAREQTQEDASDQVAASVGRQSYCYLIGSMLYRGARTNVYQCELNATAGVKCYVRPGRKPVNVDKLLAEKEVYRSLEGSNIDELGCIS